MKLFREAMASVLVLAWAVWLLAITALYAGMIHATKFAGS